MERDESMKQSTSNMPLSSTMFSQDRRRFIKQSSMVTAGTAFVGMAPTIARSSLLRSSSSLANSPIALNPLGFNGQRKDPVTGGYHLGNGYRMYNPRIMRFNSADSMSPFGKGGINNYAYALGDPVNRSDPSGHFAFLSLVIGAIVGAIVGAGISAAAEGIRAAVTGTKFDAKQVGIGAALGLISGGFGAAAVGTKTGVQIGLAVADTVVSGGVDFGLNVAVGTPVKQAGINAGIGSVVGLATFGVGKGIGRLFRRLDSISSRMVRGRNGAFGYPLGPTKSSLGSSQRRSRRAIKSTTPSSGTYYKRVDTRSPGTIRIHGGMYAAPVNQVPVSSLQGRAFSAIEGGSVYGQLYEPSLFDGPKLLMGELVYCYRLNVTDQHVFDRNYILENLDQHISEGTIIDGEVLIEGTVLPNDIEVAMGGGWQRI